MLGDVLSLQLVTDNQKSIVSTCSALSSWRDLLDRLRDGIAFASISLFAVSFFGCLSLFGYLSVDSLSFWLSLC
jgi:hypothetical protein